MLRDELTLNLNISPDLTEYGEGLRKQHLERFLSGSSYILVCRQIHDLQQPCAFCEMNEVERLSVVVVRKILNNNSHEDVVIGLDCLYKVFKVSRQFIEKQISAQGATRRLLSTRMNKVFNSSREQIEELGRLITLHTPPEIATLLLSDIARCESGLLRGKEAQAVLEVAYDSVRFYKEFVENPEKFKARWLALKHHPLFVNEARIRAACDQALIVSIEDKKFISRSDLEIIYKALEKLGQQKSVRKRGLTSPEDFTDNGVYLEATETALKQLVDSGQVDYRYWVPYGRPERLFGTQSTNLFAIFAVKSDDVRNFIETVRRRLTQMGKEHVFSVSNEESRSFTKTSKIYNPKTQEIEEMDMSITEEYYRVGFHVLEPHSETFTLWLTWGKEEMIKSVA